MRTAVHPGAHIVGEFLALIRGDLDDAGVGLTDLVVAELVPVVEDQIRQGAFDLMADVLRPLSTAQRAVDGSTLIFLVRREHFEAARGVIPEGETKVATLDGYRMEVRYLPELAGWRIAAMGDQAAMQCHPPIDVDPASSTPQ